MEWNVILAPVVMFLIVFIGVPELIHNPQNYFHVPAGMIVLGGCVFSIIFGTKFKNLKSYFKSMTFIMIPQKKMDPQDAIKLIVDLSRISLESGKASLMTEIEKIKDPFIQYGITLVVERFQEPFIRAALYNSIEEMQERHNILITVNKNTSVVAPVAGMVGTVIGLIQVLRNMADPSQLGRAMALGLIATFYGGFFSGMIFNPIAQKLRIMSDEEASLKRMMAEGILFIAKGEVPIKVEKYLLSYLNFSDIGKSTKAN
ncbi:MAG: MotA/TolQ/ExbB proton channel family protein [Candidatus Margulisbacteria bacterium]|nr:MotA/TolQ/ExbB proton channel family protein [Candidatus Margulisiibacteriota bacterium]